MSSEKNDGVPLTVIVYFDREVEPHQRWIADASVALVIGGKPTDAIASATAYGDTKREALKCAVDALLNALGDDWEPPHDSF